MHLKATNHHLVTATISSCDRSCVQFSSLMLCLLHPPSNPCNAHLHDSHGAKQEEDELRHRRQRSGNFSVDLAQEAPAHNSMQSFNLLDNFAMHLGSTDAVHNQLVVTDPLLQAQC